MCRIGGSFFLKGLQWKLRKPGMALIRNFSGKFSFNKNVLVTSYSYFRVKQNHSCINRRRTVGIIIIGDEIIKGQVKDTNSHYLCKNLNKLGVQVEKVLFIRDNVDEIAEQVLSFSKKFSFVITSGGIGPTHDDITFEGVAKAFHEPVIQHPKLTEIVKKYFGDLEENSPTLKLARLPKSAKLNFIGKHSDGKPKKNWYPLISAHNVYMLPGVPQLLEKLFQTFGEELFKDSSFKFYEKELYINEPEVNVVQPLDETVNKFRNQVTFGSYPEWNNSYYKVKVTMESTNESIIEEAETVLKQKLPKNAVVDYEKDPISKASEKVYQIASSIQANSYTENVKNSIAVIEDCLTKYSLSEMCFCFNGGKDCTALMHLVLAVMKFKLPENKEPLLVLYVRDKNPFPELEKFVEDTASRYSLNLLTLNKPIKESLQELREIHPDVKACIMGTRRTDPYAEHLQSFQPTDPGWPSFIRVSPILDWTYKEVWDFIRSMSLPYCELYDKGYTSIGSKDNTHPNPSLRYTDKFGKVQYHPAYTLLNNNHERNGRT